MILEVLGDNSSIIKKDSIKYTYVDSFIYGNPFLLEIGVLHFEIGDLVIGKNYKLTTRHGDVLSLVFCGTSKFQRFSDQNTTQLEFTFGIIYKLENNLLSSKAIALGEKINTYINGGKNLYNTFMFQLRKKGLCLGVSASNSPTKRHISSYLNANSNYLPKPIKIKHIDSRRSLKSNYCSTELDVYSKTKKGHGLPILLVHESKVEIKNLNNFISPKWELEYTSSVSVNIGDSAVLKKIKYIVMEKKTIYKSEYTKTILVLGAI